MSKGLSFNPKKRAEPTARPADLDSTSGARRYLTHVQKNGDAKQIAEAEKTVSERHPDMLIERRRV